MTKKINRREFVKNSTITGASALLGAKIITDVVNPVFGQDIPDISVAKGADYYKNTLAAVEQLGGIQRDKKHATYDYLPRDEALRQK